MKLHTLVLLSLIYYTISVRGVADTQRTQGVNPIWETSDNFPGVIAAGSLVSIRITQEERRSHEMWSGVQLSNEVKWCNTCGLSDEMKPCNWSQWQSNQDMMAAVRKMSTLSDVLHLSVAISDHYSSSNCFYPDRLYTLILTSTDLFF